MRVAGEMDGLMFLLVRDESGVCFPCWTTRCFWCCWSLLLFPCCSGRLVVVAVVVVFG